MKCPQCGFDNPGAANHCEGCGTLLRRTCPACGARVEMAANFCYACGTNLRPPSRETGTGGLPRSYTPRHLGEKILSSKSALEGELKEVTVLFADIANYSDLAHRLGPEEMHFIMRELFDLLLVEVHRFEGTVNQFLGDGIMALFGAPIAHEDHAHRALHSALGMQQTLRRWSAALEKKKIVSIRMRIGINTGPVVVGSIGDDLRMDYTAVGDTTNLAARIQQIAEPGCIFVTEGTRCITEGYFRFRSRGEAEVKGESEPVEVYELIGLGEVRDKIDEARMRGLSKLVGRSRELSLMRKLFLDACKGDGRVLFISGEAGVGKSRLVLEFKEAIAAEGPRVFEGHCRSFGRGFPYHPFNEIVAQQSSTRAAGLEVAIQERVLAAGGHTTSTGSAGHPASSGVTKAEGVFAENLFSARPTGKAVGGLESDRQRQAIFESLKAWLWAGNDSNPTVLILEDVQWIDQASEEFLRCLVTDIPKRRFFLICTSRYGRPPAFLGESSYTHVALEELSPAESEMLVRSLLAPGHANRDVVESILAKAGGNPLFIEEVVRSIREDGSLVPFAVPDTIHGIISARVDRLDDVLKGVLQAASAIGRDFPLALLERAVPPEVNLTTCLEELDQREFVRVSAEAPERRYTFKHKLFQEVIYNSLLSKRRQELHSLIARSMEDLYGARLEEWAELLAHHYMSSGDLDKALHYLEMAGAKAARIFSIQDAMACYKQALKLVQSRPANEENLTKEVDLILRVAQVSYYEHIEQNVSNLRRALNIARTLGDEERMAQVYHSLGGNYFLQGDQEKAIACYEECIALEEKLGNSRMVALTYSALGRAYFYQAKFTKAIQHLRTYAQAIEKMGLKEELSYAYGFLGMAHGLRGEWDEAFRYCKEGLAIAEETNNPNRVGAAHVYIATVHTHKSEWDKAIESCLRAMEIGEKSGAPHYLVAAYAWLGVAEMMKGELSEARQHLDHAVALAGTVGTRATIGWAYLGFARLSIAEGDLEQAMHYCHESLQAMPGKGNPWQDGVAYRVLGEIYSKQPSPSWKRAERFFADSIQMLSEAEARPSLARSHLRFGQACSQFGDLEKARCHLSKALVMFRELGMPNEQSEAARTLDVIG